MSAPTPPGSVNSGGGRAGAGRTPPPPNYYAGRQASTPRGGRNAPMQLHEMSRVPHGHVPAYLPGSASLVEELDQRVLIVLRDGKHLVGVSSKICDPRERYLQQKGVIPSTHRKCVFLNAERIHTPTRVLLATLFV